MEEVKSKMRFLGKELSNLSQSKQKPVPSEKSNLIFPLEQVSRKQLGNEQNFFENNFRHLPCDNVEDANEMQSGFAYSESDKVLS